LREKLGGDPRIRSCAPASTRQRGPRGDAAFARTVSAIVVRGVGAHPGSALQIGDVTCAQSECYGDLGAASPGGFLDMKAIGLPIIDGPQPIYNELPMQVFPLAKCVRFVTVSTCTGTDAMARAIEARTGGAVENMEGAAVAHVAHLHGVPVGEVRGISNIVTNRDTSQWKLKNAADLARRRCSRGSRAAELRVFAVPERHVRVSRNRARPRSWRFGHAAPRRHRSAQHPRCGSGR
jgi:futalosine hydrolase